MAVVAIILYFRAARDRSWARRIGMAVYVVLLGALAIVGQATETTQAPRNALIGNWIIAPLVFAAIPAWIDRHPRKPAAKAAAGAGVPNPEA